MQRRLLRGNNLGTTDERAALASEADRALARERKAVESKQDVVEVDRALEATKAVRKQKR